MPVGRSISGSSTIRVCLAGGLVSAADEPPDGSEISWGSLELSSALAAFSDVLSVADASAVGTRGTDESVDAFLVQPENPVMANPVNASRRVLTEIDGCRMG